MSKENLSRAREVTESQFLVAMDTIMNAGTDEDKETCLRLIGRANNYLENNIAVHFYTDGQSYWIEPLAKGKIGFRGMK